MEDYITAWLVGASLPAFEAAGPGALQAAGPGGLQAAWSGVHEADDLYLLLVLLLLNHYHRDKFWNKNIYFNDLS